MNKSVLVIDDEEAICYAFQKFFGARGWRVDVAASAQEGLASYQMHNQDVVFLDVRLPDRNGIDLLKELGDRATASVIVITAYSSLETTVRARQGRAFEYLVKPLDLDRALELAERVLETQAARDSSRITRETTPEERENRLIGDSPVMQEVYKLIARAADIETPVLLTGATGTGKELAARAIHEFGSTRKGTFVAVNCGALPEQLVESELFGNVRGAFTGADGDRPGRFELATGGTLFLDEVGELPLAAQVKLLRVLDSYVVERVGGGKPTQVDVRIIAATNRDLDREVKAGRFRADLYYRLAVLSIRMPLLREHKEDIVPLATHFLRRSGDSHGGLTAQAVGLLLQYNWPGNVRELRNVIDRARTIAPNRMLRPEDLPETLRKGEDLMRANTEPIRQWVLDYVARMQEDGVPRYVRTIEQVERTLIEHAMQRCNGRQSEAALYLGLHRNTLRNRIRDLDLRKPQSGE